jgi:hypothetical protein
MREYSVLTFNRDGMCLRRCVKDSNGQEWRWSYSYGGAGRLTVISARGPLGWREMQLFEYDDLGRLCCVKLRRGRSTETVAEHYQYDGKNLKTHVRHCITGTDGCGNVSWTVAGSDDSFVAPGVSSIITTFNATAQPVTAVFRDSVGVTLLQVEFGHDKEGQVISETTVSHGEKRWLEGWVVGPGQVKRTMVIDDARRQLHVFTERDDLHSELATTQYNELGDQIGITRGVRIAGAGALEPDGNAVRIESFTNFEYSYDHQHNWVAQIVRVSSGLGNAPIVAGEVARSIAYYDDECKTIPARTGPECATTKSIRRYT